MDTSAGQDVPLPYVFFPKSDWSTDPDVVAAASARRIASVRIGGSAKLAGGRSSMSASGVSATNTAANAGFASTASSFAGYSATTDNPMLPGVGELPPSATAGGRGITDDTGEGGQHMQWPIQRAARSSNQLGGGTLRHSQTHGQQVPGSSARGGPASSKSDRPPIMTPDERAWNERLIESFKTSRSLIDAIVLSPSGVVINTLGRRVEGRVRDMDPGMSIGIVYLALMLTNFLMLIWLIGNGFFYFRIIKPFNPVVIEDWLKSLTSADIAKIECSITTTISLYPIKSQVTFYAEHNETSIVSSLFTQSKLHQTWESLVNHIVHMMTELLQGRQALQLAVRPGLPLHLRLDVLPRLDMSPVPNCVQDYNAQREVWVNLHYQCFIYGLILLVQLYIATREVITKRLRHFADQRDRSLKPEQMRTRITIGLEGVAALQRICFFTKLVLIMQALVIVLFQQLLVTIKHIESTTKLMADQLEMAGLPASDVTRCSNVVYAAIICSTLQCLGFFCFHMLAKFYSTIAASKVPQVKTVPSQDESYAI